ncbi:MAG: PilC/PilY family type IV pilus protein [Xanthomonadales bacterium]|nr:PilC/PilY family type IV pilus protein [Xanthomonadales bacterium]
MKRQFGNKLQCVAGLAFACFFSGNAWGALDIASQPLVVFQNVKSNVMVVLDDSGSMSFETIVPTNDGSLWWQRGNVDSFVRDDGTLFFNRDNGFNDGKSAYLFPFTEGPGTGSHKLIPPFAQYNFMRSSAYNAGYYDPTQTYDPWPSFPGRTFVDMDERNAVSDPSGSTGNANRDFDLTSDFEFSGGNDRYHFHNGMVIPEGTRWHNGTSWVTAATDTVWTGGDDRQRGVDFYPAFYYTPVDTGTYSVLDGGGAIVLGDCGAPLPANYKLFERRPSDLNTITGDVDALGPDGSCLVRTDISAGTQEMQNFANWFSYYRKRHLSVRNGIVGAFRDLRLGFNVGYFTINNRNTVTMRNFDNNPAVDEREDFLEDIVAENFGGGTPNRQALNHAGLQFERTSNPIIEFECQKNFAVMFTDGFSSLGGIPSPGNADGGEGSPYADNISDSIADIAMDYYENLDISGLGIPIQNRGDVAVPRDCDTATFPTPLDCKTDSHMNTYMVVLNGRGTIYNVTHTEIEDAYDNPPTWPDVNGSRDPTQIDDLYHAAVNGRGLMLNAATPTEVAEQFSSALQDIVQRSRPTTALTATSTRLTTESRLYQAAFDSFDWSGNLVALALDGSIDWNAESVLQARTSPRNILTINDSGGTTFDYNNLDTSVQTALATSIQTVLGVDITDASPLFTGSQFIDFIAGDQSLAGSPLRDRQNLLGDVVNSEPVVAGPGNEGWARLPGGAGGGMSYLNYVDTTKQSRPLMVYVGANDAMMHGFRAEDGTEMMAYVPRDVIPKTAELGNPNYLHEFYVDSTATVGDAYNGGWRTILVGATGAGGRAVFALDITDPTSFDASDVLWELSGNDDPDLGVTIGRPVISRISDGRWVAIFGNGYNSQNNDGILFVVDLFTGSVIAKLETEVGDAVNPAGLASPRLELNGVDGLSVANAYIGDLQGNLWKFDLSDASPGSWSSAFTSGGNPLPLFVATDPNGNRQPITSAPTLTRTPQGDLALFFGSGKFFETSDATVSANPQMQTFFAVVEDRPDLDPLADFNIGSSKDRDDLHQIKLGSTVVDNGLNLRNFDSTTIPGELGQGWYIDLALNLNDPTGERVVSTPRVNFGVLIFTTFEPTNTPCTPGGVPRLYVLDAVTGAPKLASNSIDCTDCGVLELSTGAPLVPPVVIDKTGEERVQSCYDDPSGPGCFCILNPNDASCSDADEDEIISACPLGSRPVVVIDPVTRQRIPIGCIKEGRTVWGERELN